jgi:outer membrane protein assembly factor BamB
MRHKKYLLFLGFIAIAVTLSACAGAATTATSWPGLTADDKYAYLAYNTQVYAVDLVNGTERWRYPAEPDNNVTFYAEPTLSQDGQLIVGSYDYNLYSLNADNGAQNWVFPDAENRFIASSLVAAENIFAPAADENLYSLDLNGRLQWTFSSEGESWAKPVTDENCECLYLSTMDHSVYAVDAQNGTQIWRSPKLGGAVVGSPAYGENGELYVGTFGGKLFALSSEDGSILWEFSTADSGWIWSAPTISDGVLYFGDLNGYFYAIDATNGTELWQLPPEQLDGEIVGSPLVIDDGIYITTEAGILFKLDTDGRIVWSQTVGDGGKIYTPPREANDLILVAPIQVDELLVAFNQDGGRQWSFIPVE